MSTNSIIGNITISAAQMFPVFWGLECQCQMSHWC